MPDRPLIACICGSVRFWARMNEVAADYTLRGYIVVRPEVNMKTDPDYERIGTERAMAIKARLDELHLRKIDLADVVIVVNVDGYIGDSTRREMRYAMVTEKTIVFDEPVEGAWLESESYLAHHGEAS